MKKNENFYNVFIILGIPFILQWFISCSSPTEADFETYTATIRIIDKDTNEPIPDAKISTRVFQDWTFSNYCRTSSTSRCRDGKYIVPKVTNQIVIYCTNTNGEAFIKARHKGGSVGSEVSFGSYLCIDLVFQTRYNDNHITAEGYSSQDISISLARGSDYPNLLTVKLEKPLPPSLIKLLSPIDGEIVDNGCADGSNGIDWYFDWTDNPEANKYYIEVFEDRLFMPNLTIIQDSVSESSYHYQNGGVYANSFNVYGLVWIIREKVGGKWQGYTDRGYFSVEPVNTDCP
jgi:hypothetical protein